LNPGWLSGKKGQSPFAGTARRVLRTNGDCPLFPARHHYLPLDLFSKARLLDGAGNQPIIEVHGCNLAELPRLRSFFNARSAVRRRFLDPVRSRPARGSVPLRPAAGGPVGGPGGGCASGAGATAGIPALAAEHDRGGSDRRGTGARGAAGHRDHRRGGPLPDGGRSGSGRHLSAADRGRRGSRGRRSSPPGRCRSRPADPAADPRPGQSPGPRLPGGQ
jgi:hypothetical protein